MDGDLWGHSQCLGVDARGSDGTRDVGGVTGGGGGAVDNGDAASEFLVGDSGDSAAFPDADGEVGARDIKWGGRTYPICGSGDRSVDVFRGFVDRRVAFEVAEEEVSAIGTGAGSGDAEAFGLGMEIGLFLLFEGL